MTILDTSAPEAPPAAADVLANVPRLVPGGGRRVLGARVARSAMAMIVSAVVVLGAWQLFLKVFHVNHFIGKGPMDVWRYLFVTAHAAANRTAIVHESVTTLRDAALGWWRAPSPPLPAPSPSISSARSSARSCRSPWCCAPCPWSP